jgi:hypothetical protein
MHHNRSGNWAALLIRLAFPDFSSSDVIEHALLRRLILPYDSRDIARIVAACFIQFIRGLFLSMYVFPVRSTTFIQARPRDRLHFWAFRRRAYLSCRIIANSEFRSLSVERDDNICLFSLTAFAVVWPNIITAQIPG